MKVIMYQRPYGKQIEVDILEVNQEDKDWFEVNNVSVSMESDAGDGYITYANWGAVDSEGEPIEAIEFSLGKDCRATLAALRELATHMMEKYPREQNTLH